MSEEKKHSIPAETLEALEFEKVMARIATLAHSEPTRDRIISLRPLHTVDEINQRSTLIGELRRLSQELGSLGLMHFEDITAPAKSAVNDDSQSVADGSDNLIHDLQRVRQIIQCVGAVIGNNDPVGAGFSGFQCIPAA